MSQEKKNLRDADIQNEDYWMVRKTLHGVWVCDIGQFDSYEAAVSYATHNLGEPEPGAEYAPIRQRIQTVTFVYAPCTFSPK